jgi:hypothetical protein
VGVTIIVLSDPIWTRLTRLWRKSEPAANPPSVRLVCVYYSEVVGGALISKGEAIGATRAQADRLLADGNWVEL